LLIVKWIGLDISRIVRMDNISSNESDSINFKCGNLGFVTTLVFQQTIELKGQKFIFPSMNVYTIQWTWWTWSQTWKQPRLHNFLPKIRTKASLNPNSNHETKKKHKHDMCKIKIQQDFITRKKQKQNKVMIRKHTQN
jgi:hypothetical protein